MTKYCQKILDDFQNLLSEGYSKNSACKMLRITRETFYTWQETHPEFKEIVTNGNFWGKGEMERIAKDNLHNKDFNTNLYRTHMANVYDYADKKEIKQENSGTMTLEISEIQKIREGFQKDV